MSDFKLDRMRCLLARIGNPQEARPAVHIAGTKGKGSTATMVAAILARAGRRVGLFTSPHISAFEERMRVDGRMPSPSELVALVNRIAPHVRAIDSEPGRMSPTYFEIATALAWMYFDDEQVDIVVLEVGLGGRFDSTNICDSAVSVITNISRDHTKLLGCDLASIAREKAGIIKTGTPVVSGVQAREARDVVRRIAHDHSAPLFETGSELIWEAAQGACDGRSTLIDVETHRDRHCRIGVPLAGEHQAHNAALAVGVVDVLNDAGWGIAEHAVREGLRNLDCPLRIEVLSERPTVIVDAAHNSASAVALVRTLKNAFASRRRILVFGTTRDKDVRGLLRILLPNFDSVILAEYADNPRAVPCHELREIVESVGGFPVHTLADAAGAWRLARRLAGPDDLICVTGSFFIAAEIREVAEEDLKGPILSTSDEGERLPIRDTP
ncbi:MAG: bifunctional folylpolyglutamate synthase/dihydrofolate synthase [Planctomycetaceae bacterium]|nr:bifunctional folylpolyglutamate synthase/dihydrofolate synthase [Planctomycetaceae bacterium]